MKPRTRPVGGRTVIVVFRCHRPPQIWAALCHDAALFDGHPLGLGPPGELNYPTTSDGEKDVTHSTAIPGDSPANALILRVLPSALRPYALLARLDRPIGTWLLLFPCWWGLLIAPHSLTEPVEVLRNALLFAVGALVMRGAGCTYNDIIDRDIDAKVARTRGRPLPSGAVSVS